MKRPLLIIIALTCILTGAAISLWATQSEPTSQRTAMPVERLFEQRYPDPNRVLTDITVYRGQVLVVNFWATWCAPCIREMPELSDLQVSLVGQDVQFLGLAIDNFENVRKFAQRLKLFYPLLVVGAGGIELSRQFGNTDGSLPFTVIFDRNGQIADRTIGEVNFARLERVIERVKKIKTSSEK